jgi:hypothetical protein
MKVRHLSMAAFLLVPLAACAGPPEEDPIADCRCFFGGVEQVFEWTQSQCAEENRRRVEFGGIGSCTWQGASAATPTDPVGVD